MKSFLPALLFLLQDPSTEELLRRLGSDRIDERDEAARQLEARATDAALRTAAKSADAEIAARAVEILTRREPLRRRFRKEVEHLLEHAALELRAERPDACRRLCDAVLGLWADYRLVRSLRDECASGRRGPAAAAVLGWLDVEPWTRNGLPEAPEPPQPLREPAPPKDALRGIEDYAPEDPGTCVLRPEHRLKTARVTIDLRDSPLLDVLETMSDLTGLRIVFDAAAAGHLDPNESVSVKLGNIVADGALKLMLGPRGLTYRITEERLVLVTIPARDE
jgi:hypothetical protein